MLADILITILLIASTFYLTIVLLRFLLQLARADFYNPITQFVVKATNPPLRPLQRVIPGLGGFDGASLVLAVIIQGITFFLILVALIIALMVVFVIGNLACAIAPGYATLMIGRVVASFAHGAFFGVGSVVATSPS